MSGPPFIPGGGAESDGATYTHVLLDDREHDDQALC
jgi:hypothetical protein